jgi:hypothetical protein
LQQGEFDQKSTFGDLAVAVAINPNYTELATNTLDQPTDILDFL